MPEYKVSVTDPGGEPKLAAYVEAPGAVEAKQVAASKVSAKPEQDLLVEPLGEGEEKQEKVPQLAWVAPAAAKAPTK